jgi:hypothetical protein
MTQPGQLPVVRYLAGSNQLVQLMGQCSNLRYAPEAGLYWSLDFNVDPMTAVIAQHLKGRLFTYWRRSFCATQTPLKCVKRFEQRVAPYLQAYRAANRGQALPVIVNGDSTAKSRSTALKTDYELITEYFRSRGHLRRGGGHPKTLRLTGGPKSSGAVNQSSNTRWGPSHFLFELSLPVI